ncbi:MAG: putative O-glycosylation ligase, exosortase A system-associated [Hydrogenophaga sp.]|uniref:putative O-glycosylation ligase, exosortase A system-associated n=1 Tax=Hydrogenophaga sp. TaxID=1904254 RepID=UPI002AB85DC2|nr:putative O-glycosylation ligase, exosortase A system-associated [Hydrogenophaga sp.]MDZ4283073.1 putative O-glycosylation ligase, exosortase A system-associated [Hydrogenophaga sp.]
MRDIIFAAIFLMAVPLAIVRPFNAYILWAWTSLLAPTTFLYGFMVDVRVNLIFALIALSAIALGRVNWRDYQGSPTAWMMIVFAAHASFVAVLAYPNNPFNLRYYEFLIKGLAFCLIMPFFVRERVHFHAIIIVVALGLGIHGVTNGLKTIASAGGHNMTGPFSTMIDDRNHLSVALSMALPLVLYLFIYSKKLFVKVGFLATFLLIILAILGGGSRAGFIVLSVLLTFLLLRSKHKIIGLCTVAALVGVFLLLAPDQWADRISTIQSANQDESFLGRVVAWDISSSIALENPIFGGGFHAVQVQHVWDAYKFSPGLLGFLGLPVPDFLPKAAHSIYFELIGDTGFLGLTLFLSIMLRAIYCRQKIIKTFKLSGREVKWQKDLADLLALSVMAYLIGGASVSLGYLEVAYMLAMLMELLFINVKRGAIQQKKNSSGLKIK